MSDFFDNYIEGSEDLLKKLKILMNPVNAITSPIELFKKTAKEWYNDYTSLTRISNEQLSPELIAHKNRLLKRGEFIMDKIRLMGFTSDQLQNSGLGIIPLLAGGVIATAAGLMVYWTTDFIKFSDRFAEYKSLREAGLNHGNATRMINEIETKPGAFDKIKDVSKNVAIAGGLFVVYKIAKNSGWV